MPKLTTKEVLNNSQNKNVKVNCLGCKRNTNHVVVTSLDISSESSSNDYDFWGAESHQIVRCLGCGTLSFRVTSMNSEDTDYDEEEGGIVHFVTESLFPIRSIGRSGLKDAALLPVNIQRIYEETISAMNNSQPVLAGIGIRAIVETVCKNKKSNGNNLSEKIDGLASLGLLTSDSVAILHKIRSLGNDAAHRADSKSRKDLIFHLKVLENLIQQLFVYYKIGEESS